MMNLTDINIIKQDERGTIYDCGKSKFISRHKGTISANHRHEDREIIYLVEGKVELTIGDETKIVEAPIKIDIPAGEYHKLVAFTDISLVLDREH